MTTLKIERWGGTKVYKFGKRATVSRQGKEKVYVVRDDKKRILIWKKVKGSGLSLNDARAMYRRNGAFTDKYHYNIQKFGKRVTQKTKLYYNEKDVPKKERFGKGLVTAQYSIGTYGVNEKYGIFGRSNKITDFSPKGRKKAYNEAAGRFYCLLDRHFTGRYDEDEGMELAKQNDLKIVEGFVWYESSSNRRSIRKAGSR